MFIVEKFSKRRSSMRLLSAITETEEGLRPLYYMTILNM